MKRTEMVGKISDVLMQFFYKMPKDQRDLIADVVLTEVEREGMLPPYNPKHLDHGAVQDCEWEPEVKSDEYP